MPTIKDVAREAGVSIMTVSRVVNKDPAVRGSTRDRVERVIATLGYAPDPIARSMRSNRTGTIGLITDEVATSPYSVDIISGVQDACAEAGRVALIANTKRRQETIEQTTRTLLERRVDGIVYATMYHRCEAALPDFGEIPLVLVNCFTEDGLLPSVVPDDYAGGYAATRYLIQRGHRDIALVSLNPVVKAAKLRHAAFQQALQDHDLAYNPDWVRPGRIYKDDGEPWVVRETAGSILSGSRRPSAIVCGNDTIAMRVYNLVRAQGLRIPEDISVIGYDNYQDVVEGLDPPLTTVALPYYRMGQLAVQRLGMLIEGQTLPERHLKVTCPLVERESCRSW